MKTHMQKSLIAFFSLAIFCLPGNVQAQKDSLGENYQPYYKNVFKFETFSPLLGHTTIAYARFIKPKVNVEFKLGVIGLSLNITPEPRNGFYLKVGPTFYSASKNEKQKGEGLNFIEGLYLRPEITFTQFQGKKTVPVEYWDDTIGYYNYHYETKAFKETYCNLMLNSGIEFNLSKRFQLDLFAGLGYELGFEKLGNKTTGRQTHAGFRYSHAGGGGYFPIAVTSGFTMGYRF